MNRCRVSDIMAEIAANAEDSGLCATTAAGQARIVSELNMALKILMKRCDTDGALWWWPIPVSGGCFSLPEDCLEARQVFLNGFGTIQREKYYQGQLSMGLNNCGTQCCWPEIIDLGDFAIPQPLPNVRPIFVTLIAESNADAGKEVVVEIINRYGERKKETLTMLANMEPVRMEESATEVTYLGKDQTDGPIKLYLTYDNGQRFYLCEYGPKVQSGAFRRKKLPQRFCGSNLIRVFGKMRQYNLTSINDIIPICDTAALSWALSAVTALRRKDPQGYNDMLTLAVNEIYKGLQDKDSASNVQPIHFMMGTCNPSQAGGGRGWS